MVKTGKMRVTAILLTTAAVIGLAGCKSQHPASVTVEPGFNPGEYSTILVVPTISTITKGEDRKRESEKIPNRILWEFASERYDYKFLSPEQFRMVVAKADLGNRLEEFKHKWSRDHIVDLEFCRAVQSELNVDLLLVPVVYLWHKDETDYREASAASVTQVGMSLSLINPKTGTVVWEATDENYKESVRSEGDRIQASSAGIDRRISGTSISGGDIYAAPPFDDVTVLVLEALVGAIPERSGYKSM
ncbi:MAG: hypothetical protein KAU49_07085 [Candidatus Krumholzibacteria bacterium]|nr:hypothetical protein [Candidatus Krumholzibacteria bacterium]